MLKDRKPKVDYSGLVRLPFPAEIAIETHSFCNFRCVVCPYPSLQRPKGSMCPELFYKIVDEVVRESPGTRLWLAIMGEPLIDRNLVSLLRYAQRHGAPRIHLNTNGTFLEGELAKEIMDAGVESVYVAIDANTAETFNVVRPGGDFNRVVRNVENFIKLRELSARKKPEIAAQFIVMDENAKEVDAFHDFWLKRGAVVKIRLRQGWGQSVSAADLQKVAIERFPCPWLLRTMNIHWNGIVTQCDVDYEEQHGAGDVNVQSIKKLWDGELAKRRERHWANDYQHPLCANCHDWAAGRAEFLYPDRESEEHAPRFSSGGKKL